MTSLSLLVRPIAACSLALALAACGGGGGTADVAETPAAPSTPAPAPELKALFNLASAQPAASPASGAQSNAIDSRMETSPPELGMEFVYDAYVVTAVRSGTVTVTSTVVEGRYALGYGFPISMGVIENGPDLRAFGGNYLQDALQTGVAVTRYSVQKDQQYILVYKTFGNF